MPSPVVELNLAFFFCKFTFILTLLDHVAFHVAILTKRAIIDVTSLPSRMHTRTHSFVEKLSVQIKPAAAAKAAFVRNLMVLCAETKNSSAAVQFEVPGAHTQKTRLPLLRSKQARLPDGGRSFFLFSLMFFSFSLPLSRFSGQRKRNKFEEFMLSSPSCVTNLCV